MSPQTPRKLIAAIFLVLCFLAGLLIGCGPMPGPEGPEGLDGGLPDGAELALPALGDGGVKTPCCR